MRQIDGWVATARETLSLPVSRSAQVWVPWADGPERAGAEVLVSLTEFRADSAGTLPGMFAAGLRLRMGWFAMPGAVGLWLWSRPGSLRAGSVSVWHDEQSLTRFVRLPEHGRIVRRFHQRGEVAAVTWSQPWAGPAELRAAVAPIVADGPPRAPDLRLRRS
jgi:hypothetical protein